MFLELCALAPLGPVLPGFSILINQHLLIMSRSVHGNHQRFVETYFSSFRGYYFSGDGALRDEEGFYQITGRMDDVINVTGHRLGTAAGRLS